MTLVGCYGSEERLIDCAYHEFEYSSSVETISMDITINCIPALDTSQQQNTLAMASLSIAVFLALAVIVLVAVLVAMLVLRRRKKSSER